MSKAITDAKFNFAMNKIRRGKATLQYYKNAQTI